MNYHWNDVGPSLIRRRYDHLAKRIVLFEWLLFLPPGFRKYCISQLGLRPGDAVVELGCGTGRNLPFLRAAVGPEGRVFGVDLSDGMLARARKLCEQSRYDNVELIRMDAVEFISPRPLDAVLFGLSYNTMPHHLTVLHRAWDQLKVGGRLAVMDAKAPAGLLGKLTLPFGIWLMKRTFLGNPLIQPQEHLRGISSQVTTHEFLFGSYYIAVATK